MIVFENRLGRRGFLCHQARDSRAPLVKQILSLPEHPLPWLNKYCLCPQEDPLPCRHILSPARGSSPCEHILLRANASSPFKNIAFSSNGSRLASRDRKDAGQPDYHTFICENGQSSLMWTAVWPVHSL